jgi:tetratricopeptide (TPR) repeat protein
MIRFEWLEGALTRLTYDDLLILLDEVELAFLFKHALLQDTVYATLLRNETRRLHLVVALTLEHEYSSRLDEYAAEISLHFAEAEEDAKTLEFSTRAADAAMRVFANAEALEHYTRAINIANTGIASNAELVYLYRQRGRILEVTGKFFEALASYRELHNLAEERNDRALELEYLMLCAPLHSAPMDTFDPVIAKQLLLDALGTARELGDEVAEARILWNLTLLSVHTLKPEDGVMYGELSLELAQKLGLEKQSALSLHELFIPYRSVGKIERARHVLLESRERFRALDDRAMMADSLGMSAQFAFLEGKPELSLEYANEGLAISKAIENEFGIYFNESFLAQNYIERGEFSRVLDAIADHIRRVRGGTVPPNMLLMTAMLAWFFAGVGAIKQSDEMARLANSYPIEGVPPVFRAALLALLARTSILKNDLANADEYISRGMTYWHHRELIQPAGIYMPYAQAELALAYRDGRRALQHLDIQADVARTNEYSLLLIENRYLAGIAYMCLGDISNAESALLEARERGQAIMSRRVLWSILGALGELEHGRGNLTLADSYHAEANEFLAFIIENMPPELRDGFVRLPAVQRVIA